jgi:sugar phosphate isomerase/epimerase
MPYPISVQLYSLRKEMADGKHAAIIKKLGETGYKGVEPAGFHGMTAKDFRKLVADNGMTISSSHTGLPNASNIQQTIDTHKELGCEYFISGFWGDDFKGADAPKKCAERVAFVHNALKGTGLKFALHNHWDEFTRTDGKLFYDRLIDACPDVQFEIDTYWACNFGAEKPAEMVARFKSRTPFLHLKDGNFEKGKPHVACGKGKQDFPAIVKAADPKVLKWVVVELDECATDMVEAVTESYRYLVGAGLAEGRVKIQGRAG